jgi:hypothetical protein
MINATNSSSELLKATGRAATLEDFRKPHFSGEETELDFGFLADLDLKVESFQNPRYAMLDRGRQRANRLLDLNGYNRAGPRFSAGLPGQGRAAEAGSRELLEPAWGNYFGKGKTL